MSRTTASTPDTEETDTETDTASGTMPTRRQEVLAVAAGLFASRGYHGTSMRDIAEALSMRAPSLYKHVRSKDALLEEVVDGYLDELLPRLEAATRLPGDGATRLAAMIQVTIDVGRRRLDEFLTLSNDWNQIRRSPGLHQLQRRTRAAIPLWLGVLEDGIADGSLRADLDPKRTLRVVIGVASAMVDTRFDDIAKETTAGRAAVAIDTVLGGLRAR